MADKISSAHEDDDSSQQPRQHRTPSAEEQRGAAAEDRIKERQALSDKSRPKKRRSDRGAVR